jgi:hypothetical protein
LQYKIHNLLILLEYKSVPLFHSLAVFGIQYPAVFFRLISSDLSIYGVRLLSMVEDRRSTRLNIQVWENRQKYRRLT